MSAITHEHRVAKIIRAQVAYTKSHSALVSARKIIEAKISNSQRLVSIYLAGSKRAQDDRVPILTATVNRLANLAARCAVAPDQASIFQLEARAARVYWRAFAMLSHLPTP